MTPRLLFLLFFFAALSRRGVTAFFTENRYNSPFISFTSISLDQSDPKNTRRSMQEKKKEGIQRKTKKGGSRALFGEPKEVQGQSMRLHQLRLFVFYAHTHTHTYTHTHTHSVTPRVRTRKDLIMQTHSSCKLTRTSTHKQT